MSETVLLQLIAQHRLVIRPSVLDGKWVVGRFLRVYLDGKIEIDHEVTAETPGDAIQACIASLYGTSSMLA